MRKNILQGKVSFVNHEKNTVVIEYEAGGKKKTINGTVDEQTQKGLQKTGIIKKIHQFHIGDTVSFTISPSARGDKMVATAICYLYNTSLDMLLNKAKTNNSFVGYLKIVDDKYFVKEAESYLFFPLAISPWQLKPSESELNETVSFMLENLEKKEKVTAKLFKNTYIPEFQQAVKLYKSQSPTEASVHKVTPHGIYLNLIGEKIRAKIPFREGVKVGDTVTVKIAYLSPARIVAEAI